MKSIGHYISSMRFMLSYPINTVTYITFSVLSFLVPKKKNLVSIIPPKSGSFSDNSKYAYLSLEADPRVEVAYITYSKDSCDALREAGVNAVVFPSWRGSVTLLRSAMAVGVTNHGFHGLGGHMLAAASKVQLWHGSGVKNVALQDPGEAARSGGLEARLRWSINRAHPFFDVMYFPSVEMRERRRKSFRFREARINGLLRNDLLLGKSYAGRELIGTDPAALSIVSQARSAGRRVVLYAPTWRNPNETSFGRAIQMEWTEIDALLQKKDAMLIVKLHTVMKKEVLDFGLFKNIIEYDRNCDIYPALKYADILVTDISSIATDVALNGTPIILYVPDLKSLVEEGRIYSGTLDKLPGERVLGFAELKAALTSYLSAPPDRSHAVSFIDEFHSMRDARSGERFVNDVVADLRIDGTSGRS